MNDNWKERFERLVQEHIDTINRNEEKQQRIDKAIEYMKDLYDVRFTDKDKRKLLEILGDKE